MPDNTPPRITVITPSLNQVEYLERAICSVLDQGYDNLEYIVIDGGSCDGSVEIIGQYADELAYWHSRPDTGPADAVNQAIERATGEIIAVLNADDLYLPGTLETVARKLTGPDAPSWLAGHCLRIGEMDEQLGQINARRPLDLAGFMTHDGSYLPASVTFYKKAAFDAYGWFDPDLQFAWHYELNCRLIAQGQAPGILPTVLAAHRDHAHSKSAQNTLRCGGEYCDAMARYTDRLPFHQRNELWADIDQRRRVYNLAKLEMAKAPARRSLWRQMLRQPWWLANSRYRKTLLRGISAEHAVASAYRDTPIRRAA